MNLPSNQFVLPPPEYHCDRECLVDDFEIPIGDDNSGFFKLEGENMMKYGQIMKKIFTSKLNCQVDLDRMREIIPSIENQEEKLVGKKRKTDSMIDFFEEYGSLQTKKRKLED